MQMSSVRKIARVLKILVTITFAGNLIVLPFIPELVRWALFPTRAECWSILNDSHAAGLIVFLVFCGCCTAVILWQGRRVLATILRGEPFSPENAVSLKRAAVCAFCISGAALVRLAHGIWFYRSIRPIATYNALFVPVFAMAGLLCLVMSALFRQAARIKAENDLTI